MKTNPKKEEEMIENKEKIELKKKDIKKKRELKKEECIKKQKQKEELKDKDEEKEEEEIKIQNKNNNKKLNDLEIMTTLFESKLESLPDEIKSTFPPLQPCNLDDVNPNFSANVNPIIQDEKKEEENQEQNKENQENQEEDKKEENNNEEEKKEETGAEGGEEGDNGEMSPQQELDKFLAEHGELQNIYKMLKLGVPSAGVIQKAKLNQLNMDLVTQLIEIAKKLNPNIV